MGDLEERLRERFKAGLVVDAAPADRPTRLTILRKRVAQDDVGDVGFEALELIAETRRPQTAPVSKPDPAATGQLELVQMRQIPPREPLVDRVSKPKNVCDGPTMKIRPDDDFIAPRYFHSPYFGVSR
jgi:hypothetical protein